MAVRRVADLDFAAVLNRPMTPSPSAWEDEVLYFLLVDRFSDGREDAVPDLAGVPAVGSTPRYSDADNGSAVTTDADAAAWRAAGLTRNGGTIAGITGKLGYLSRLGVSTLWISPVLKQSLPPAAEQANYHGYATGDFLSVEPAFGSNDDLRDLVDGAMPRGYG